MNAAQHYKHLIQPRETVMRFVLSVAPPVKPGYYNNKQVYFRTEASRKNRKHPELSGLSKQEYNKEICRRYRVRQKAAKQ